MAAIHASAVFECYVIALYAGKGAQFGGDRHRRAFLKVRHVGGWSIAHHDGDPVAGRRARQVQLKLVTASGNIEQRAAKRDFMANAESSDILLCSSHVGVVLENVKEVVGTDLRCDAARDQQQY